MILAQVEPAAADAPLAEILFGNVGHVTGVAGTVGAPVDDENIEFLPIIPELFPARYRQEFRGRAVADRAAFGRFFTFKDKAADGTAPCGLLFRAGNVMVCEGHRCDLPGANRFVQCFVSESKKGMEDTSALLADFPWIREFRYRFFLQEDLAFRGDYQGPTADYSRMVLIRMDMI
jgi:hypothetical protein